MRLVPQLRPIGCASRIRRNLAKPVLLRYVATNTETTRRWSRREPTSITASANQVPFRTV
jgi:hypothetical protein